MTHDPLLILFAQIGLILVLSRGVGIVFTQFKQPQIMGEMFAGILLGPSVFGWVWPAAFNAVFPTPASGSPVDSTQYLHLLSQVAVVFFLFLIGLELDPKLMRSRGRAAVIIGATGIVVPLALGALLTLYLFGRVFDHAAAAPMGTAGSVGTLGTAALFMGAAMATSAFPVLARILTERNLQRTRLGALAITCAAINDIAAWCLLAVVVIVARIGAGQETLLRTVAASCGYVLVMLLIVRPFVRRLGGVYERRGRLSQNVISVVFLLVLASAYAAAAVGLHAFFGALLMGCIMPKGTQFIRHLGEKLEDYTVVFLLPIFFAYTGLQTKIGLLNSPALWLDTGLVILVACLGKFGGTALAARACRLDWRESSAIGILMNTRGLMELVILALGRELGIINDTVFAMMVLMALVTTALTAPVVNWVYPRRLLEELRKLAPVARQAFSILIPVSLPKSGGPLVQLADMMLGGGDHKGRLYALHLRHPVDHAVFRAGLDEAETPRHDQAMEPLLAQARSRELPVEPLSFISTDIAGDIARVAAAHQVSLVLMGFHKPVLGKTILGGTVHRVLMNAQSDVAIFVDRGFRAALRILVPYLGSAHDLLALELAGRMVRHSDAQVTVLHIVPPLRGQSGRQLDARALVDRIFTDSAQPAVTFRVIEDSSPVGVVLHQAQQYDLVVVGVAEEWGLESHLFGWRAERIARDCPSSLLIVRKFQGASAAVLKPSVGSEAAPAKGGS